MRLFEFDTTDGIYVGVRFCPKTVDRLHNLQKELSIPNPLDPTEFHTTVCYSSISVPWQAGTVTGKAKPMSWAIYPAQDGKNCLVLELDSEYLHRRHYVARSLGATHGYPSYKPHVTLSYDVGEFSVDNIELPDFHLDITEEYTEALNPAKFE
jgi:hypothetical protein